MTRFSRFQERNKKRTVANSYLNRGFVAGSNASILISQGDQSIQATVVNKQERDFAYIFTSLDDELKIGSVWAAKDLHLLVAEEITIIQNVQWRKYQAFLCNIQIGDSWGYFKGPEKSFLDVSLEKEVVWESPQKPVLVLPENILSFRDKIVIKNRAWLVQEYDAISTPGLVYYSLKPTTMSKKVIEENIGKDVYIEKYEKESAVIVETPMQTFSNPLIYISPNIPIVLNTEDGYFKTTNKNLKIQKRTTSQVIFIIPFGVLEATVEIKEKGDIVTKTYRVVD